MRKYLVATAACALGASTLLGACGGKELSKADFITKADAICSSYETKSKDLDAKMSSDPSFDEFRANINANIDLATAQFTELKDLGYPKGDKETLQAIYDDANSATALFKTELNNMSSMDEVGQAGEDKNSNVNKAGERIDAAAKKLGTYGSKTCGNSTSNEEPKAGN